MNRENDPLDFPAFFCKLDQRLDVLWGDLIRTSPLLRAIDENRITRELYAIYMVETYHYTGHNARNQALVGMRTGLPTPYMKFCLEHAADEVGHEKMALHDVNSLGILAPEAAIPVPLMETDIFISYLYWISQTGNPLQRLGYSYWAESCYKYINPLLAKLRKHLDLQASQMTFFIAHSDIDAEHFEDIKRIIERTCKSQEDLDAVTRVMESTLKLTGDVLNACHREYECHLAGQSKRCAFVDTLAVS
ncbi:iron-containing redox enzyme family protein [Verminephrobacter eiseniae]|nr:iron-containing redox enzyme family protein [Verminephrobacter eiseniae]